FRVPPRQRRRPRRWPRSRLVLIAAAPYPLTLVGALTSPPRGYDALWYHLPMLVGFSRQGHLEPPGRDLVFFFPGNFELLGRIAYDACGAWVLGLLQWPFALAVGCAAGELARTLGGRRVMPVAGALVLSAPIVAFQSQMAYADVAALFFVTAAATFL